MAGYDAICFDLDHTLCEPTRDADAVLRETFDRAGVEPFCSPGDLRAAVPDLPTAETDREFYRHLFTEVASRAGVDPGCATALAEASIAARDPTAVRFRPGAKAALELARERGPVALITNGGQETQTAKLEALDVADAFDVRVFTDPAAGVLPKPDPAPFERALSALAVEPERAIHVGDSRPADVAGANGMGMDSAWIDVGHGNGVGAEHAPTYELSSLEAFERLV